MRPGRHFGHLVRTRGAPGDGLRATHASRSVYRNVTAKWLARRMRGDDAVLGRADGGTG